MIQEVTGSRNISFLSTGFSGIPHMRYYYIFLFIAYFISFLGNSCLMFVIITDRNLQTPKHITVFNLSLTDICESITEVPQQLGAFLFGNQLIPYGLCLCDMLSNMLFVSVHSLTLSILSFEILVAICLPLRYHMIVTHRSMLVIIGASWTLMRTIISRLSFCRTRVRIIHFSDRRSHFPSCVSMSVLFQFIIMFPVFSSFHHVSSFILFFYLFIYMHSCNIVQNPTGPSKSHKDMYCSFNSSGCILPAHLPNICILGPFKHQHYNKYSFSDL